MSLQDLPKPGVQFRAKTGPGSFLKKMKRATRYGELKGLQDNVEPIVETMRDYQTIIRRKGGLDRLQRQSAWKKIKDRSREAGVAVTKQDARDIKKVLEHFDPKNKSNNKHEKINKAVPAAPAKKGWGIFSFRKKEDKPPVPRYLRAIDRSYEDQRIGSSTGVSIESIRNKPGGASRIRVDISKSGSRRSAVNPLTGAAAASRFSSASGRRLDINPVSGGANQPARPLAGPYSNPPSSPAPPKLPPKLAV